MGLAVSWKRDRGRPWVYDVLMDIVICIFYQEIFLFPRSPKDRIFPQITLFPHNFLSFLEFLKEDLILTSPMVK